MDKVVYIDTSCMMKLLINEPESLKVEEIVARQPRIIVSTLTELETTVQLRGLEAGGKISRSIYGKLAKRLDHLLHLDPFHHEAVSGTILDTALTQVRKNTGHCRTMDRLHLAAMELLGVRRILTHDEQQAAAAQGFGFSVTKPN